MRAPRLAGWLDRVAVSRGRRAVALTLAAAVGLAGAVAITAFASPGGDPLQSFGPDGDGRTRLLVTAPGGLSDAAFEQLQTAPAVDSAQRLFTGQVLVAGFGITPAELRTRVPGAAVTLSPSAHVDGAPMNDPGWSSAGWDLSNNGANAVWPAQAAPVAGDDIDAPAGWAASTGRGQVVAILDTGMVNHEDLAGALWTNPNEACGGGDTDRDGYAGDCHGWNFYANNADVTNATGDASHGTAVAGTVGARANNGVGSAGVAPGVTIMPLVIGSGETVNPLLGAQAIKYAADHGATAINASWGGPGGASMLQAAIDYANSKGVLVVVAAGNDNADRGTVPVYPASLSAPNLVVVGASRPDDTKASFSAFGATTVDLFAPGNAIYLPWWQGGYRPLDGTSFASPLVAGAAALYRAVYPNDTPAQLKARMLNDTTVVPALKGLSRSGRLSLTALGNTAAAVNYTFTGMSSKPGTVAPTVVVNGSSGAGDYSVQLGLGMESNGQVYALADEPITVGDQTLNTGDDGMATFSLGQLQSLASQVITPSAPLQDGRYVLTAQLFLDGAPVGRTYAAPLLVSDNPTPSLPTPGTPDPSAGPQPGGGSDPGTPQPGTPYPGTPQPGTPYPGDPNPVIIYPGTPQPGSPYPGDPNPVIIYPGTPYPGDPNPVINYPGTPQPGSPYPGNPNPVITYPGAPQPGSPYPGDPNPGTPQPGTTNPGTTSPGTPTPGTTNPGTTNPGTTNPGTTNPGTPTPGTTNPGTTNPSPGTQPAKDYPGNDAFGLTSINPSQVSTAGGTLVTITGTALPAGAKVRVGPSAVATVVASSATRVTFVAPALVVGVYDVSVFAPDGTAAVLSGGLTYVDGSGAAPQPGSTDPGSNGPGSTDPGVTDPGAPQPGGGSPGGGPVPITGAHGERLVPSALFAGLGQGIWGVNCGGTCSGLAI